MYKLSGTVKVVNPTVQVSEKFSKREFVVSDTSGMYPQDILFQLTQDKCTLLDGVNVNDTIEVSFNLRGREWTNPQGEVKYFNSLDAWRIDRLNASSNAMPSSGPSPINLNPTPTSTNPPVSTDDSDDDLPF
jgi:hypothetical protein